MFVTVAKKCPFFSFLLICTGLQMIMYTHDDNDVRMEAVVATKNGKKFPTK